MVLEAHHHAVFLGGGDQLVEALLDPAEALVEGAALGNGLAALIGHEIIEALDGAPSAGVDADGGDAQLVGEAEALGRVGDILLAHLGIRRDKALVGGETHQWDAHGKGVLLDLVEQGPVDLAAAGLGVFFHVDMEDLDAVEAHEGSLLDAIKNWDRLSLEMPEGVGGDTDAVGAGGHTRRQRPAGGGLDRAGCRQGP